MNCQNFTIIIDTREQRPFDFQSVKIDLPATVIQTLKTGDYSILGLEDQIVIERKSLADLFGSVGSGRKRFVREMQRMADYKYAALVLESSLNNIFMNPPSRSKMSPKAVFRSIIAFSVRYGVHVWPAWSRASAEKLTYLILKRYYDDYVKEKIK